MGKLFNLKEWLTLDATARYLSVVFDEQVAEADVLRLGLDGRLRLSVHFVNHARARRGEVVGYEGVVWDEFPAVLAAGLPNIPAEAKGKPVAFMKSLNIDGTRFLNLGDEVVTLHGVWDLSMVGGERLDIEHEYQRLTGGPQVTLQSIDGAFVERRDGHMYQLQESLDNNEFMKGSNAQLAILEARIAEQELNADEAARLRTQHKEARQKFLEETRAKPDTENYYPAGGLPEDAVIVVRTEALREFEQSVNGEPPAQEKPLTTSERNSMLTVIAALCEYSAIDPKGRGAAGQIAKLTEELGAAVSDDTVRRLLNRVPNALESRMK